MAWLLYQKTESKRVKQLCTKKGGLLDDIIGKSEEHFELTAMRWDML
jgi:hypothetical protein